MSSARVAAVAWLIALCPLAAQGDSYLPAIGGSGGVQFIATCPAPQVLTGFEVRWGHDVDSIRPLCVTIRGNEMSAPAAPSEQRYGGLGGSVSTNVTCPPDTPVVVGLFVMAQGAKTIVVNDLQLFCGFADGRQQDKKEPDAIFSAVAPFRHSGIDIGPDVKSRADRQRCAPGLVAIGAHGRAGEMLDALGLICDEPRRAVTIGKRSVEPQKRVTVGKRTAGGALQGGSIGTTKILERAGSASGTPAPPAPVAAASAPVLVYALHDDQGILWDRHSGASTGNAGQWLGSKRVGSNSGYARLMAGGDDFYALKEDGVLSWLRHRGSADGSARWDPPIPLGTGWDRYAHLAPAEEGFLYTITPEGVVHLHQNQGWSEGTSQWSEPIRVAQNWRGVKRLISGGDRVLYTIMEDGRLLWRRHDGRDEGTNAWTGPREVGTGWETFTDVHSPGGGVFYALRPDGTLLWYRYPAHLSGEPVSWEGPLKVHEGWSVRSIAALPAR